MDAELYFLDPFSYNGKHLIQFLVTKANVDFFFSKLKILNFFLNSFYLICSSVRVMKVLEITQNECLQRFVSYLKHSPDCKMIFSLTQKTENVCFSGEGGNVFINQMEKQMYCDRPCQVCLLCIACHNSQVCEAFVKIVTPLPIG